MLLAEPSHTSGNGHWWGLCDDRSVCAKSSALMLFSFDLAILFLESVLRNVIKKLERFLHCAVHQSTVYNSGGI